MGPVGLILSTPLTLCLVVLGRHVEHFEFFDVLLGDRPALTPIENFINASSAGDADEAQEHAEELLKRALPFVLLRRGRLEGLQLAVNDATRGVPTGQQLDGIRSAVTELVEDLDAYEDKEPAPTKATQPDEGSAGPSKSERSTKEPAIAETAPPPEERPRHGARTRPCYASPDAGRSMKPCAACCRNSCTSTVWVRASCRISPHRAPISLPWT